MIEIFLCEAQFERTIQKRKLNTQSRTFQDFIKSPHSGLHPLIFSDKIIKISKKPRGRINKFIDQVKKTDKINVMKSNKLRISLVQNSPIQGKIAQTKKELLSLLKKALKKKPHLIMLPEVFLGSPASTNYRDNYIGFYRDFFSDLQSIAKKNSVYFFGSLFEEKKGGGPKKYVNRAFLLSSQGKVVGFYDKIHLFPLNEEPKVFSQGDKVPVFKTPWGKCAPMICYDLRFPELLRKQALQGARFAVICAQWPKDRDAHWMALLKARAIENQMYIIACNRLGKKRDLSFVGHSCVISPWGDVEYLMNKKQSVGSCVIQMNEVEKYRKRFPFLKDAIIDKRRFGT